MRVDEGKFEITYCSAKLF